MYSSTIAWWRGVLAVPLEWKISSSIFNIAGSFPSTKFIFTTVPTCDLWAPFVRYVKIKIKWGPNWRLFSREHSCVEHNWSTWKSEIIFEPISSSKLYFSRNSSVSETFTTSSIVGINTDTNRFRIWLKVYLWAEWLFILIRNEL